MYLFITLYFILWLINHNYSLLFDDMSEDDGRVITPNEIPFISAGWQIRKCVGINSCVVQFETVEEKAKEMLFFETWCEVLHFGIVKKELIIKILIITFHIKSTWKTQIYHSLMINIIKIFPFVISSILALFVTEILGQKPDR